MTARAPVLLLLFTIPAAAVRLKPETEKAFAEYLRRNDSRISRELRDGRPFLWVEGQPEARRQALEAQLRQGQVVIEELKPSGEKIPDGMLHHWVGLAFAPRLTRDQALSLLTDYDNWQSFHQPYFQRSRSLGRDGNDATLFLRLHKKKVVTNLFLDTEHVVRVQTDGADRGHSRSVAVKILEVQNPGEPDERHRPPGDDRGYLWRYVSYWRLLERDGGVYVQLEALSLSREPPMGLGWALGGSIRSVHKEYLVDMVTNTRAALVARYGKR